MKSLVKYMFYVVLFVLVTACSNTNSTNNIDIATASAASLNSSNVDISSYKASFINQIANIRARGALCGGPVDPLRNNYKLETAAKAHAKDMALNHFVQHDGSGTASDPARKTPGMGSTFIERIIFFGYPAKTYDLVGETITYTKFSLLRTKDIDKHFKRALQIILNDPPHCRILMNPRFKDIGIGVYRTSRGYYWAIDFGETK